MWGRVGFFLTWNTSSSSSLPIISYEWHCTPPNSWSNMYRKGQPRGKWFIILDTRFKFGDRDSLWSTVSQSKYRPSPAFGKNGMNRHRFICCGGMFDGCIIHMCEARVRTMRLIGGNSLKTLLLILMSIAHSYSILCISYVLMSPYCSGMDRVVIGSIWVANVCGNSQVSGWWGRDPEYCMRAVRDYDASQDCEVCKELGRAEIWQR